jgi:hypothetical protein
MNDIGIVYDQAMAMRNDAFSLREHGDIEEARKKFLQACASALQSASLIEKLRENEPRRSVLFLEAASSAFHGEDLDLAERLVGEGLSGYPPDSVKKDLRKLLDDIKFALISRTNSGMPYEEEAEIRLYGDGVGYGRIKPKCLIERVDAVIKILSRTIQRKYGLPFEAHPKKRKAYPDYQVDIAWAEAGSFGIKICLTQKVNEQLSLFQSKPSEILKDFIDNIALLNSGETEKLRTSINNEEYYVNFIAQAKEIFPDGNIVDKVGISTKNKSFSIEIPKSALRKTILENDNKKRKDKKENNNADFCTFIGQLKVSDDIHNKFQIIQDNDQGIIKIKVKGALEALVKKYFGGKIEATCTKKGKIYRLINIIPLSA